MVWSVDWWMVLGWAGFGIGLVVAAWALLWDRARGRLRCPKCWYDMAGAKAGEGESLRCPECGRVVKRAKELKRTRRRWRWGVPALVVMVLGFVAGSVHDPAGVRSRGWVALVPTPLLVMIAPVGDVMQEKGAGDERTLTWDADPTGPVLREFYWRMFRGEIAGWEGRWFFARVERRFPETVESIIQVMLPRMEGGDVWIYSWFPIEYFWPSPMSSSYPWGSLPSRMRLVGSEPSEWMHYCRCTIDDQHQRWSGMSGEGLERGRYMVEHEYYLPLTPPNPTPYNWLPRGEKIFVAWRKLWTLRKEIVIDDSRWMMAYDESGIGDELVRQLDPVIWVEEPPGRWSGGAFLSQRGLHAPVTDPWRALVFGLDIKLVRDGRVISKTTAYFENPATATSPHPHTYHKCFTTAFRTPEEIHVGDVLTLIISGNEEVAAERLYVRNAPSERWSGEVVVHDLVVVGEPESQVSETYRVSPALRKRVTVPPMEE